MPSRSMGTRAGFMVDISTGHHNSRASVASAGTNATYVRVPTAMEFHPARYDINLRRINALASPPCSLSPSLSRSLPHTGPL